MLYLVTKNWATAQRNHCIGSLVQGYLSVTCWDISSSKRLVLIWESHLGKPSLLNSNGIFMTILQFFKGESNLVRPLLESMHLTGLLSKAVWQGCISKKKKKISICNQCAYKDVYQVLNETEVSEEGEAALIWRDRNGKSNGVERVTSWFQRWSPKLDQPHFKFLLYPRLVLRTSEIYCSRLTLSWNATDLREGCWCPFLLLHGSGEEHTGFRVKSRVQIPT